MFIGSLVSLLGLGILLWLLFTLAIYALPFFVGLTSGCSRMKVAWVLPDR